MTEVLIFSLGLGAAFLFAAFYTLKLETRKNELLADQVRNLQDYIKKVISQKKSSEVRVGQIAENLAPFLKDFKYDPKTCHFLGQPIDYIVYSEDEVVFIEVKSGEAKLSQRQRRIRDNIQKGNVRFEEFRVK